MGEERKKHLALLDTDTLHFEAIRRSVSCDVEMHHVSGGNIRLLSTDIIRCWDLILFSLDYNGGCSRLHFDQLFALCGQIPVVCYASNKDALVKLAAEYRSSIPFYTFSEILHKIADCMQPITNVNQNEGSNQIFNHPEIDLLRQVNTLSPREMDIFSLFGKGHGPSEIAALFNCGVSTVETHIRNIRSKLMAGSSSDLRRMAHRMMKVGHCRAFLHAEDHVCHEGGTSIGSCPHARCA